MGKVLLLGDTVIMMAPKGLLFFMPNTMPERRFAEKRGVESIGTWLVFEQSHVY